MDAGYAELGSAFASASLERAVTDDYAAARSGRASQRPPAPRAPTPITTELGPGAPAPAATGLGTGAAPRREDGVGCRVLVPRALWPQYTCNENGGAGWSATVVAFGGSTAVVSFTVATTADGRRYEDERLPLASLRKV